MDVNVHPTKLEIKFSNERAVFEAVYCAVKNAVSNDNARNEMLFERSSIPSKAYGTYNSFVPVYDRIEEKSGAGIIQIPLTEPSPSTEKTKGVDTVPYDDLTAKEIAGSEKESEEVSSRSVINASVETVTDDINKASIKASSFNTEVYQKAYPSVNNQEKNNFNIRTFEPAIKDDAQKEPVVVIIPQEVKREEKPLYKYLGVAFNTYIIIEYDNKMMIIDKHAAHERILFESMQENREKSEKHVQLLLIPIRLEFSKEEIACLENYSEEIGSAGFEFEIDYALGAVSLLALPGGISQNEAIDLFSDILSRLSSGTGSVGISRGLYFEKSLYQASCKAAMKGGRSDAEEHLRYIVETLLTNPKIRYCPHGRPVIFELTQSTIEHKFKRT